jgi:hypothetical protein
MAFLASAKDKFLAIPGVPRALRRMDCTWCEETEETVGELEMPAVTRVLDKVCGLLMRVLPKLVSALRLRQELRVKAREGAQLVGGVEIHHQHVDRTIAAGLQLKAAFHLEGGAQQHGQRRSLAQQAGDRGGIAMAGENGVHGGAQPHHAAAHIQRLDREGDRHIVQTPIGDRTRRGGHHAGKAPRHQAMTPFCA